ncbi:MAG: hypothetical protein ACK4TJ_07135 [Tabrizicola sp.]
MTLPLGKLEALSGLYQAVAAVRPFLTTSEERAALQLIEETMVRLADAPPPPGSGLKQFDAARLHHLLQITGPDLAAELLARLTEDLTATEAKLAKGAADLDWKALREASHVLISLSGSVGAISLQEMAENLNAIAHARDQGALDRLMPTLAAELAVLIRLIRSTKPPEGPAA